MDIDGKKDPQRIEVLAGRRTTESVAGVFYVSLRRAQRETCKGTRHALLLIRRVTRGITVVSACVCCAISLLGGPRAYGVNPEVGIKQYAHSIWRSDDYRLDAYHLLLTQTRDGYLWIAHINGLLRFDGVRFTHWLPPSGSLPANEFGTAFGSRDGSLWLGTSKGVSRWKDGKLTNFRGITTPVTRITEDEKGTIWLLRTARPPESDLCEITGDELRCYGRSEHAPTTGTIQGFATDSQGYVCLGTDQFLYRWKRGVLETYELPGLKDNADNGGVNALAANPDGSIWVGASVAKPGAGLQLWKDGRFQSVVVDGVDSSSLDVESLLRDRFGVLWIGTASRGLFRIRGMHLEHFDVEDGLTSKYVKELFEDREGTVWLTTDKGLENFHDVRVVTYAANEFKSSEVDAVTEAHDGGLWVGTEGSLSKMKDGVITDVITAPRLPGNQVTALFEDRSRRLWVGVDQKLFIYEGGRFRPFLPSGGLPPGMVTGILEDTQGDVWMKISGQGLVHTRDQKIIERFPYGKSLPLLRSFKADPKDGIWLGLMNGDLGLLKSGKVQIYPFKLGPSHYLSQIVFNYDGSLFGDDLLSLVGWKQGHFSTMDHKNGLPCDRIFTITKDQKGSLWLYMRCGLVELRQAELSRWWANPEAVLKPIIYDSSDGVRTGPAPFQSAAQTPDGKLWFSSGHSLQMIDPESNQGLNVLPPPVHVEEISARHIAYRPSPDVLLPKGTHDLDIRYTALSLRVPSKVQFRYKLEGQDSNWVDAADRREAFYTNLKPGRYRFLVIAANDDGIWNQTGDAVNIKISPAFYETSWFRVFLCLVVLLLLTTVYLFRLRQITKRLEAAEAARTEERLRIARELHDTLLQGFQGLALRFHGAIKNLAKGEPLRINMETILDNADEVLAEGRQRIRELRSEMIVSDDLAARLSGIAKSYAQVTDIKFSLHKQGVERPLNATAQDGLELIATEALSNAYRHAEAQSIVVMIIYRSDDMSVTVSDDGTGIDDSVLVKGRSGHWGLQGMRERAASLGGKILIKSRQGRGTVVEIVVPGKLIFKRSNSSRIARHVTLPRWVKRSSGANPQV